MFIRFSIGWGRVGVSSPDRMFLQVSTSGWLHPWEGSQSCKSLPYWSVIHKHSCLDYSGQHLYSSWTWAIGVLALPVFYGAKLYGSSQEAMPVSKHTLTQETTYSGLLLVPISKSAGKRMSKEWLDHTTGRTTNTQSILYESKNTLK